MFSFNKQPPLIVAGRTSDFSVGVEPKVKLIDYLINSLDSKYLQADKGPRLICIDYNFGVLWFLVGRGIRKSNSLLIRTEPSIVLPQNFRKSTSHLFGETLTLGGDPSGGADSLPWPQVWPEEEQSPKEGTPRLDKIVSINGNKLSLISGELYSLRRRCLQKLPDLVFFGKDWDLRFPNRLETALKSFFFTLISLKPPKLSALGSWFSRYPKWGGAVADKRKVMSDYKYALVIENSQEYMSEKLFDAFFAGCIPIYVGPLVSKYGIPKELVIQADPDLESIRSAIESARSLDYEAWFRRVKSFLESECTRAKWSHQHVYQEIANRFL